MRLLLDTHAWFWWMMGSSRLPAKVASAIGSPENDALVSAVSVYELILKHHIGKLPEMALVARDVERQLDLDGFGRWLWHPSMRHRLAHSPTATAIHSTVC